MATTKKKIKRCKTHTVGMTTIKVYSEGVEIGYGWTFHTDYGSTQPDLFTLDGNKLEAGWYDLVAQEDKLAVMGETIQ